MRLVVLIFVCLVIPGCQPVMEGLVQGLAQGMNEGNNYNQQYYQPVNTDPQLNQYIQAYGEAYVLQQYHATAPLRAFLPQSNYQGCCSYHNGFHIRGNTLWCSRNGKVMCADLQESPTCGC